MGIDASWPLQRVILTALSHDKKIVSFLGSPARIYDGPVEEEVYPYVKCGENRVKAWQSATFDGQEHELNFNLWSREGGYGQSKEIAAAIIERLHDADLKIPGHALVDLQFESSETRLVEENETYHCRLVFKGLTVSD